MQHHPVNPLSEAPAFPTWYLCRHQEIGAGTGLSTAGWAGSVDFGALGVMEDSASSLMGNLLNSERAEGYQDVSAPGLEQDMLWKYRKYSNIL